MPLKGAWAKAPTALPKVLVERTPSANRSLNMRNLPATITINSAVWTRTASASQHGTYSYGSHGGTNNDIARHDHYTVSPDRYNPSAIYNVHYTVYDASGSEHHYYYVRGPYARTYWEADMPDAIFKQLKYMVDKLLFTWTWRYVSTAFGPATKEQVS